MLLSDLADKYQICDIANIRAHRIFDMLGIMELATALISNDTATHHLAAACLKLPAAVLLPDHNYFAAEPRCNAELIVRYGNWLECYSALKNWAANKSVSPKVVHTYEQHEPMNDRCKRAQTTWPMLYQGHGWIQKPFAEPYPRDSRSVGDKCGVPYINDILTSAMEGLSDNDIVVFTNSDIVILPYFHNELLAALARSPVVCSSRRDITTFADVTAKDPVPRHIHCGRDLFAFRVWWLKKYLPELPPVFIGRNDWDNLFVNLMRLTTGTLITGKWCDEAARTITDCELASGRLLHEWHKSYADNEHLDPSNEWNRLKLREWGAKYCPEVSFPWTDKTVKRLKLGITSFLPFKSRKNGNGSQSIISNIRRLLPWTTK